MTAGVTLPQAEKHLWCPGGGRVEVGPSPTGLGERGPADTAVRGSFPVGRMIKLCSKPPRLWHLVMTATGPSCTAAPQTSPRPAQQLEDPWGVPRLSLLSSPNWLEGGEAKAVAGEKRRGFPPWPALA